MPRVIINPTSAPGRVEKLIERLAAELQSDGEKPLPLIVERNLKASGSRHVHVIWDQWGDLEGEERSAVIVRAYARVEGEENTTNISIALGLQPEDANLYGLLPFKVVPARAENARRGDYLDAIGAEAEHTVMGEGSWMLRYPTFEEAERALERIKQQSPGTDWTIVEDTDEEE